MKTILAIDTSTTTARIAVVRNQSVLFQEEYRSERSHNAQIFQTLKRALEAALAIDLIAVGTGPGSYTGIRIGIAAAHGISLQYQAPLIGLPSLVSLCELQNDTPPPDMNVIGDARRGMVWYAEIREGVLLENPQPEAPDLLVSRLKASPSPLPLFTPDLESPLPDFPAVTSCPSAVATARKAAELSPSALSQLLETPPTPIYLAAPFVTQPKKLGKSV